MTKAVIVGMGPTLLAEEMGKEIDSADIVIRLDHAGLQLTKPKTFGSRTDVIMAPLQTISRAERIDASRYFVLTDSRHNNETAEDMLYKYYARENCDVFNVATIGWEDLYNDTMAGMTSMRPFNFKGFVDTTEERVGIPYLSKGLQAVVCAATALDIDELVLAGFDSVMSGQCEWSITRGPIYNAYPPIRWDVEQAMLPLIQEETGVNILFLLSDKEVANNEED